MFSIDHGLLNGSTWIASPNFNERPDDLISAIVVHNISLPAGQFSTGHVEQLFTNCLDCSLDPSYDSLIDVKVSAHVFIKRSGEVVQFVNFNDRAWHAGVSVLEGRENCNDFSIGIELEGCDDIAYSSWQYDSLIAICLVLMQHYPNITAERIVGHDTVAPNRKTDPGIAFDWQYFRQRLNQDF